MLDTKIITFLTYKKLFSYIEKENISIPISYLKDNTKIESFIDDLIKNFDNLEAVSFSSFLNAIVQTNNAEDLEKIGLKEIKGSRLDKNQPNNGLLFHRDNLLYIITKLIAKKRSNLNITGQKTPKNVQDYFKSLLLINEFVPAASFEKDYLIRAYPYYYMPNWAINVYEIRLQRYWYIFSNLFAKLEESKKNYLNNGIEAIEKKANLSLRDYFRMVVMIYNWYLQIPNIKKSTANDGFKQLGFNYKNIDSFYIRKANFGEDHDLLKLIEYLALDLDDFKSSLEGNAHRKNSIHGFYANFQTFFDHPVFKINNNNFCIIDLKFLFEGLCSGFMWHINNFSDSNLQSIKEQYGYLLELYFIELLKKIFCETKIQKPIEDGCSDVTLETEKYIIILEFTTEYYLFASLYAEQTESFKDDLHRLLFNEGKNDPKARGKKVTGKFFKLNGYIEKYKNSNKKIIPILVTENYLGDYDLLNRFDNSISESIEHYKLDNLKKHKPIILNLDDFECFWQIAGSKNIIDQFAISINKWEENATNKGHHHFLFSFFTIENKQGMKVNSKFRKFFNFQSFMKDLLSEK